LLTADALRRAFGRHAVGIDHLLFALWANDHAELRAAFDASGWSVQRLAEALRSVGLDAPTLDQVRRAYAAATTVVQSGFGMPRLSPEVAAALDTATSLVATGPDDPANAEVHLRHLVAGVFATDGPSAGVLDDELRRAVAVVFERATDREWRAGQLSEASALEQRQTVARLVRRAAPEAPPTPPPRAQTGRGGGAANDRAEGDDRLNFSHYVQAFADLIDSPDTRPPLTIGIFGAWGSGKSFILRHVTDEIKRRSADRQPLRARAFQDWLARGWRWVTRATPVEPARDRSYVYCIEFNAWEYNAADHIWPRLVRRVLDGVEQKAQWHRTPIRWVQTFWRKLRRNFVRKLRAGWKGLAGWLVVTGVLWWAFAYLRPEDAERFARRVFGAELADDTFSVPAILGALTAGVKLVADTLLAPLGGWVTALLDDGPGYGAESDFVRAMQSDLRLIDRQLVTEGSRVLIVIDDLDRCEPNKAVEVLQAINQLLDRKSFIICLGIDARVITAAVEKHYEDLLGPAGITGYEYLDKIVQIPFRIPDPNGDDVALFVSKQLGDPPPPQDDAPDSVPIAATNGDAPAPRTTRPPPDDLSGSLSGNSKSDALHETSFRSAAVPNATAQPPNDIPEPLSFTHEELRAFQEIRHWIRPNPRHVKRLVNVYALVRSLATLGKNRTILDDPAATVRWLTLCAQWPYAVHRMLHHLDLHGPPATPDGEQPCPPLRCLFDAISGSLDPAKRARFDHDPSALAQLIASSEGISWDELRVLRGYTVNFNPALDAELRADASERTPHGRRSDAALDHAATAPSRRRRPPAA
jgi:Cdc6-like AAA superfamily ATPase